MFGMRSSFSGIVELAKVAACEYSLICWLFFDVKQSVSNVLGVSLDCHMDS